MIRTILLVEDDRTSAALVKKLLQREGYRVLLAGNGIEALEVIAKQSVQLVITDVVMPLMDGVDLYDALKKNPKTQYLPVIIITDKQMFKEAFSALGVEHFVAKPDDISLLVGKIKSISMDLQKKEYRKVLVSGSKWLIVEQMNKILVAKQYLVTTADSSADTLHKAFLMAPHIILLDLRMDDHASTKELIRALRCFHFFHNTQILTYAHIPPDDMNNGATHWQIIEDEARACQEAGDARFIGNFSQVTFLQQMKEFLEEAVV